VSPSNTKWLLNPFDTSQLCCGVVHYFFLIDGNCSGQDLHGNCWKASATMIGASNHFEVAIATSTMLFGLSSGAALATVAGGVDRGAGDADAGKNLFENHPLV
jgi:hypothetical protein